MRWTKYFVLSCTAWACCHALSLPQATPLPHKRTFGNLTSHDNALANATANGLGNGTASAGKFGMKFAAGGGTITMDVGPLSAFTQTTTSIAVPTGTGYVILPTDYPENYPEIPAGGIYVVFFQQTSEDLLEKYKAVCVPSDISNPACIEGIAAVVQQQAPDLQKRFFRAASLLLSLAAEALVVALIAHLYTYYTNSGQGIKVLPPIHYNASVLAGAEAVQSATGASVILVETVVGDAQAITISTAELTAFNPSPTTSASPNGTLLLTSDSSGHFILQIQATDMPALLSFETALAGPAPTCNLMSPLIERDDNPEVYIEAMCLADELMHNAQGLMNPNGFMKTFQHQVVEVAERLPPNFVPNFPDLRTAGAFAIFLGTGYAVVNALFPGYALYLLVAGFVSFLLATASIASNTVGKLGQSSGVTQIVLQVTKEELRSESICLPDSKPYDCEAVWCDGNNDVCTGEWTFGCPCCPSFENTPSCDTCNSANPTNGTCATPNPGCPCYVTTTQNSNQVDPVYDQLALQIWNSLPAWVSTTAFPYMEGVTCRPDNSWYGDCKYPDTSKGSDFGSYQDFENCLTSFNTPGTPQSVNLDQLIDGPNPTWPSSGTMGQGSSNVTMICPISGNEVNLIINVAYADGCVTDTTYSGQVKILDPIGDGSINGLDILRGSWYGCLNMAASYNPSTRTVDMVPGSAGQGQKPPDPPAGPSLTVYPGASNLGLGGWNQVGCLIYETIPTKNNPSLAPNQGTKKPWFFPSNWDQYVKVWPTLAQTYYNMGSYYCPIPPILYYYAPPPCAAFPCPLGSQPTDIPSAIGNLIYATPSAGAG